MQSSECFYYCVFIPDFVRQVSKHGPQLLTSMINAMDDKDDGNNVVTLEAMSSLSKILYYLNEKDIRSVLIHIAIRIRPFFDNVSYFLYFVFLVFNIVK